MSASESAPVAVEAAEEGRAPAAVPGLVRCAKNVHAQVNAVSGAGEPDPRAALRLRFPGMELVSPAAGLLEGREPWATGSARRGTEPEGGQFRVTVGPGVVQLSWTRPVRIEKTRERQATHGHAITVAEWESVIKDALAEAEGEDAPKATKSAGARREITGWSRKSRANMCKCFAQLDYSPIVSTGRIPAMVTLTYPGDWVTVAPCGKAAKRHLDNWAGRYRTEWGEAARYIWKLEFQARGAPHFHLWLAPPTHSGKAGLPFRKWLSKTWADVVDHPDPAERANHECAGTAVDVLAGLRASDPKRLAIYFTKHSSPNSQGAKEYQHVVPQAWRAPGKGPGRFWGKSGLKKATTTVEMPAASYINARRVIRRWSRNQPTFPDPTNRFPAAVNPRTVNVSVPRVDAKTGKVTYRRLHRRRQLCSQGGLAGGFALVNNGPEFASQLARALAAW